MRKSILVLASFFGLIAVAFGAFGAHGLKKLISPEYISMWEKGVQYQFYHALALIVCAIYLKTEDSKLILNAAYCFVLGILFFSGSLYLLATRELTGIPTVILGPITPVGGFFFIAGWGLILVNALKKD
jgi:uncharacterized membrane protein YgdD (TMEM256/DUF423 family)